MVGEFDYFCVCFDVLFYVSYVVWWGEDVLVVDEMVVGKIVGVVW